MGQRVEVMIMLGSQYYDAADASIDCEWAVAVEFVSQSCSLHHRFARACPRKEWVERIASCFCAVAFVSQTLQIITQ